MECFLLQDTLDSELSSSETTVQLVNLSPCQLTVQSRELFGEEEAARELDPLKVSQGSGVKVKGHTSMLGVRGQVSDSTRRS